MIPLISVQSVVHLSSSIYGVGRAQFVHPIIIYSMFHNFHLLAMSGLDPENLKEGVALMVTLSTQYT